MANPKKLSLYKQSNFEEESDSEEVTSSEEEVSEELDSNPSTSLNYFRNFEKPVKGKTPPSDKWTRFGTVKRLLIYPVDHGTGLIEKTVICTKTGPEFYSQNPVIRAVKDRALVIYKAGTHQLYLNPKNVMVNLSNKMDFYYGNVENNQNNILIMKPKFYDKMEVPVYVRDNDIFCQNLQRKYKMKNQDFRIAYFKPEDRIELLNSKVRYEHENWNPSGLLANYSHYTLINTRSLDAFKSQFDQKMKAERRKIRSKNLSYTSFFPHIVIEGDRGSQYQEDSVIAVKIANVEFNKILPCVHNENDLKLNCTNKDKHFKLIYQSLLDERLLSKCFSELHHDDAILPVFGLNMEKANGDSTGDEYNKISEKDVVYVKFRDASNPLASNPP